jgi:CRP-like cAMP-binding protein
MDPEISAQDVDRLVELARRFQAAERYAEAAELLLTALRLAPGDGRLKDLLAETRRRASSKGGGPPRGLRSLLREQVRRDSIDAAHFLGLAHVYAERGDDDQAVDCLQVAKAKDLGSPGPHKLLGRIHFRRRQYDEAAEQLAQALRWNPFDRETAELLGRAEFERHHREDALAATAHAFLLVHESDGATSERLRRRVQTLTQILGWGKRELARVFRRRQEELDVAFDRLQWRRERFLEEEGLLRRAVPATATVAGESTRDRIGLAARLRRHKVLAPLSDEQVFELTRVVEEEVHEPGATLFEHLDPGRDLYLLARGELAVQRSTSYGTFTLGTLVPGDLLGEGSFIGGGERSGDAVATTPLQLFRFDADALDRLLAERGDLAVQVYWILWHALARKLRSTNAQLQSFFDPGALPENFLRLRRSQRNLADSVKVASDDKIRLFREQGLSRKELMTLATFSQERRFPEGSYVFQEGDEGKELYVIVDGRVMICKYIPGGGEEALAILDRGDFFGEMSLLDGEPRSADARAYGGPLTVLALGQSTVREVLSMDADAALEFLRLLCRLLADRLREIDEKVIGWRILAGGQTETRSA